MIFQDAIVTMMALAAAWSVVRKMFAIVEPSRPAIAKCASCPQAAKCSS